MPKRVPIWLQTAALGGLLAVSVVLAVLALRERAPHVMPPPRLTGTIFTGNSALWRWVGPADCEPSDVATSPISYTTVGYTNWAMTDVPLTLVSSIAMAG